MSTAKCDYTSSGITQLRNNTDLPYFPFLFRETQRGHTKGLYTWSATKRKVVASEARASPRCAILDAGDGLAISGFLVIFWILSVKVDYTESRSKGRPCAPRPNCIVLFYRSAPWKVTNIHTSVVLHSLANSLPRLTSSQVIVTASSARLSQY